MFENDKLGWQDLHAPNQQISSGITAGKLRPRWEGTTQHRSRYLQHRCTLPGPCSPSRGVLLLRVPIRPAQDPSPEDSIAHQPLPRQEELLAVLCVRLRADSRTAALPCAGQHWCNPGWIKPKAWVWGKWDGETRQSGQGTAELQTDLSQGAGEGFSSLPRPTSLPVHTHGDSSWPNEQFRLTPWLQQLAYV